MTRMRIYPTSDLSWVLTVVGGNPAMILINKKNYKLKKRNYYVSQGIVEANKDRLQDATHLRHGIDCQQLLVMVD